MRILVTQTGNDLIKAMSKEHYQESEKKKELERSRIHTYGSGSTRDKSELTILDKNFPILSKSVKIKQKKIQLPKYISEKYNTEVDGENSLIPVSKLYVSLDSNGYTNCKNNSLNDSPNRSLNQSVNYLKEDYTLKEIIPQKVYKDLEKTIIKETEVKNKQSKINESNMRIPFRNYKDILRDIEDKAEKKIKADKINLIHYLNTKNKISENFIRQIAKFDDERINKINKISQIFSHSQERDKILKKIIKSKIKSTHSKEVDNYKKTLANMGSQNLLREEIFRRNERPVDDKERYKYIHEEVKKHWEKFNVNHLVNPIRAKRTLYTENDTI